MLSAGKEVVFAMAVSLVEGVGVVEVDGRGVVGMHDWVGCMGVLTSTSTSLG